MLIRKNTKAFKTIEQIISACKDRVDRRKLIRLFITKAGHTIDDRIPVEGIEGGAELFYDMTYQVVLNNLKSASHQLQHSDDTPGIYFFHSSSNKSWDEAPFEFDELVGKEFATLNELPVLRKKEKTEKYSLPTPRNSEQAKPNKSKKEPQPAEKKKATISNLKPASQQPEFNLRNDLYFTDLERVIFRNPQLTRRDILTYYNQVSERLLPWLKERPLILIFRRPDGRRVTCSTTSELEKYAIEVPQWIKNGKDDSLLCNDREHLLFFVEAGCVQFDVGSFRLKSPTTPDYLVLGIDSPDADATKAIGVAHTAKAILDALKLPSYAMTSGISGLHLLIALNKESSEEARQQVAEYLCKLIRLKTPDRVVLEGSGDPEYGKVKLEFSSNKSDSRIVAPYSLFDGENPLVATPLSWGELSPEMDFDFSPELIIKRIKNSDPWEGFGRRKVSANDEWEKLENHYSFLF